MRSVGHWRFRRAKLRFSWKVAAPLLLGPIPASAGRKRPVILYSTYTFLKFKLQEHIQTHYVWCSPTFEGAKVDKYAIGSGQPGSSDPATIFRQLRKAVADCDGHDEKIAQQKKTIAGLAVSWFESKLVDEPARNEILAILEKATFADWRPLIFVISGPGCRKNGTRRACEASE